MAADGGTAGITAGGDGVSTSGSGDVAGVPGTGGTAGAGGQTLGPDGEDEGPTIPKPSITSFSVDYLRICKGSTATFTAMYENGTATIDHSVGSIGNGEPLVSPAIAAKTVFTLTVSSAGVPPATATVTVDTIGNGTFAWTKNALDGVAPSPVSTKLKDGRVLLIGDATAQIFDPHDESFTSLKVGGGVYPSVAALDDSHVLLAGGFNDDSAFVYNLDTNSPARTGSSMIQPGRYGCGAIPLSNGKFLLAGGLAFDKVNSTFKALKSSELYEPAAIVNGKFSLGPDLSTTRWGESIAVLPGTGRVLLAGGCTANGDGTQSCSAMTGTADLYDPTLGSAGSFLKAGALSVPRFATATAALANGQVLVAGGLSGATLLKTAELYDPLGGNPAGGIYGAFGETGAMGTPREFATATLLNNGKVLIAGGNAGNPVWRLDSAEIYDPSTGQFTTTGPMRTDRDGHAAVALANGMVLVFGGQADVDPAGSQPAEGAELYCP